jgi:phage gpG-like protein
MTDLIEIGVKIKGAKNIAMSLANWSKSSTRAISRALGVEAMSLTRNIVLGIRNQAPAGEPFMPLMHKTIKRKGSSKALIDHGDLIGSINAKMITNDGLMWFVGVNRGKRNRTGNDLVNIAEIHEFGAPKAKIPARPFLRPEYWKWTRNLEKRLVERIASNLGTPKGMRDAISDVIRSGSQVATSWVEEVHQTDLGAFNPFSTLPEDM